jgi:WD40 repeat protein
MAEWYYRDGEEQVGPINASLLKQLARSGKLIATDLVRPADVEKWYPAAKVAGLFETKSEGSSDAKDTTQTESPAKMSADKQSSVIDSAKPRLPIEEASAEPKIVNPMEKPVVYSFKAAEETDEVEEEPKPSKIKRILDSAGVVIDFAYQDSQLYVCTHTGLCVAWDFSQDRAIRVTQIDDEEKPKSIAVSKDGTHVLISSVKKGKSKKSSIHHWNLTSDDHPHLIHSGKTPITALNVTRSGFICWLADGHAYASRSKSELSPFKIGDSASALAIHPGSDLLSIAKLSTKIETWRVLEKERVSEIICQPKGADKKKRSTMTDLSISPNCEFAISSSGAGSEPMTLRLWNLKYRTLAFEFDISEHHAEPIRSIEFVDDERFLSSSKDAVSMWSVAPPRHYGPLATANGGKAFVDTEQNRLIALPVRPSKGDLDDRHQGLIVKPAFS